MERRGWLGGWGRANTPLRVWTCVRGRLLLAAGDWVEETAHVTRAQELLETWAGNALDELVKHRGPRLLLRALGGTHAGLCTPLATIRRFQ